MPTGYMLHHVVVGSQGGFHKVREHFAPRGCAGLSKLAVGVATESRLELGGFQRHKHLPFEPVPSLLL